MFLTFLQAHHTCIHRHHTCTHRLNNPRTSHMYITHIPTDITDLSLSQVRPSSYSSVETCSRMPCVTSTPGVLLWSCPTIQSVSRLLPPEHRVISGHRVSVVDLLVVVILQGPHSECLQVRRTVITSVSSIQTSPSRQRAHLSGHASSTQASTRVSEQTTPCLRLWVEQIDVFKASSTVQCQSWVQTTIPQTLNPLFGAEVHRSHILWSKAHILWSELFIIFMLPNRQVGVSTVILFIPQQFYVQ